MLGSGMGSLDLPHLEDLALEGSLCSPRYSSWLLQDRAVFPGTEAPAASGGHRCFLQEKKKKEIPSYTLAAFPHQG